MNLMFLHLFSLVLVIGIVVFVIAIAKKTTVRLTIMNTKIIVLLFSCYLGILLATSILFFLLPINDFAYEQVELYQHDPENPYTDQDYYSAIDQGRFEDARGISLREEWAFEYEGDSIQFKSNPDPYVEMRVMVDRKDVNDNKIEMAYYTSRTVVGGFDITEEVGKYEFNFDNGTIFITKPRPYELQLSTFNSEFPTRQFTDESIHSSYDRSFSMRGENIIFLKIPKDLEIKEQPEIYIQYIKKRG